MTCSPRVQNLSRRISLIELEKGSLVALHEIQTRPTTLLLVPGNQVILSSCAYALQGSRSNCVIELTLGVGLRTQLRPAALFLRRYRASLL